MKALITRFNRSSKILALVLFLIVFAIAIQVSLVGCAAGGDKVSLTLEGPESTTAYLVPKTTWLRMQESGKDMQTVSLRKFRVTEGKLKPTGLETKASPFAHYFVIENRDRQPPRDWKLIKVDPGETYIMNFP